MCSGRTRQHSRIDCVCLLRSDQYNNIQYDQLKPENTVKLRTRMTEIIRQNIKFNQNKLKFT